MIRGCHTHVQSVERSALVRYTPGQMLALVGDVERYPEFLPWCVSASVQPVREGEVIATVEVARSVLRTRFATRNVIEPDGRLRMTLESGPFRALQGEWRFDPIGTQGARVTFHIDFEFDNRLLAAALNAAFESICSTLVNAFADRARAVYG